MFLIHIKENTSLHKESSKTKKWHLSCSDIFEKNGCIITNCLQKLIFLIIIPYISFTFCCSQAATICWIYFTISHTIKWSIAKWWISLVIIYETGRRSCSGLVWMMHNRILKTTVSESRTDRDWHTTDNSPVLFSPTTS